jgi:alpha-glucosidase
LSKVIWWKKSVFYQIYPRSFADGNGDGIGDFQGMISRLDYLKDLGVDAVWISPCFPSPLVDVGYDISDYVDIAPEYGTLQEFDEFLEGAHRRGIRVILDLVLNHTSHLHPWFIESRSSRDNPKRDWYVWQDGNNGGLPNNWDSSFGGSAWEYDSLTGQYYYHFFFKEQPDLNWRNSEVKQAMWDAVRFWLERGVDGFRLDAIGTIFEDPSLKDHTVPMSFAELQAAWVHARTDEEQARLEEIGEALFKLQTDLPEVHGLMKELRQVVDEYPGKVLVGENEMIEYYGNGDDELHLVFNFPLMQTDRLTPAWVLANQKERLEAMPPGAWPCNTLGNHDCSRVMSHYGDGEHDQEWARLSVALMLTLQGTPFLYNGEEIGMTDFLIDDPKAFRDNLSTFGYQMMVDFLDMPAEEAVRKAAEYGRDKNRTPMQWENAPNAGFNKNGVQPWLPVNPNYAQGVNVADQERNPDSLLTFYKKILKVRKDNPALSQGIFTPVQTNSAECLAYMRQDLESDQACLVVMNMSPLNIKPKLSIGSLQVKTLFSSGIHQDKGAHLSKFEFESFEVYIAEIIR